MLGALAVDFHRSIHIDCLHQFSQGIGVKLLNAHIGNIGGQRNTPFALRFVDSPDIPVSGLFGLAERTYGVNPYVRPCLFDKLEVVSPKSGLPRNRTFA